MKPRVLTFGGRDKGIAYHRLFAPLEHLERGEYIELKSYESWKDKDLQEGWKWATHIVISRHMGVAYKDIASVADVCTITGKRLIVDVDDWWYIPADHPKYRMYQTYKVPQQIERTIQCAHEVWTTTKHLAKKIRKLNKNVVIIPNAIDTEASQWKNHLKPDRPVTFGYIGAGFHHHDIEWAELDLRDVPSIVPDLDGEIYMEMTRASKGYKWHSPTEYGNIYREFDVSLVPLSSNEFNKCKSPLKLAEAAFTNTALIIRDVKPYSGYLRHEKNCLVANTPQEFKEAIRRLKNDREKVIELADNLRRDFQHWEMDAVNQKRLDRLYNGQYPIS